MEAPEETGENLSGLINANFEWLLVRENGKTFPLRRTEMDIVRNRTKVFLEILDDNGSRSLRVRSFAVEGNELHLDVAAHFGRDKETIRLVPRVAASELAAETELARLAKANEIAALVSESCPGTKIARIALNNDNGRLAQISLETDDRRQALAFHDLTDSLAPELLLTTAVLALRELQGRKNKPVSEIWLICEKKQARNLQKLHALLNERQKSRYRIFEITRKKETTGLTERRKQKPSDLWREKPKKINLPAAIEPSGTAQKMIALDRERIDVIFSKQGETLRSLGLPFARVRTILGREKAWFGIDRNRRPLDSENWEEFLAFVGDLQTHRSPNTDHRRHELYRTAPEAWLESILRRNIKLLDANLILSPLYNQFRASSDKIDLLAIRKDGRLVIIELKTSPDRETVFQAADYWRKIELQRRKGELQKMRAFGDMEILDQPALVYVVAPALSFHRDFALFAKMLSKEIELWRFELHENWRSEIKVLTRRDYPPELFTNL
jgi:hypothetical protein